MEKKEIIGKCIAGIDYGKSRIGLAYCNQLQININTYGTISNDEKLFENIEKFFKECSIEIVVIGFPLMKDQQLNELCIEINEFSDRITEIFGLSVYKQDEYMSSIKSVQIMLESGYKKSVRSKKGTKDKVAAAIILKNFLEEI